MIFQHPGIDEEKNTNKKKILKCVIFLVLKIYLRLVETVMIVIQEKPITKLMSLGATLKHVL